MFSILLPRWIGIRFIDEVRNAECWVGCLPPPPPRLNPTLSPHSCSHTFAFPHSDPQVRKPCLLNGVSGTGKSVIMNAALFDSVDDLNLQVQCPMPLLQF